jgi:hypothetical protein
VIIVSIGKDFSKEKFLSLKVADLPELCYVYVESTHEIAIVKKGEVGYFPSVIDTSNMSKEDCIAYVDEQNELLEVSPEEAEMMSLKSMFGWVDGKIEETVEQPESTIMSSAELAYEIGKQANLSYEEVDELIHDINNLRADEWYEDLKDKISDELMAEFKKTFNEDLLTEAKKTLTIGVKRPIKLEIVDKEDLPAGYKLTPEQELDALDQIQTYLEKTMLGEPEWLFFNGMQFSLNYIELDDHLKASFNVDTSRTEDYARNALEEFIDTIPENLRPTHVVGIEGESEPCLVDLVILPKLEETLTEDLEDEEEPEESYDDTDSAFNELVKELVETNDLYKRVVEEIIEDADGYSGATLRERVLGRLQDILNGGLSNGSVSSLIYYSDTCAFFDDYEDEIYDFIEYMVDNSVEPLDVIKSHCSTAEILTQTDTVKNWVVWMVYEEIAYIFDAKIYDISEE